MENKIQNLEDELKVLKNEVQAVLLDIKDFMISSGGIGGGITLATEVPSMPGGPGGGGAADGLSALDSATSPYNLTAGAAQPNPQQVYVTQLPAMQAQEPVPEEPSVPAFDEEPEPVHAAPPSEVSDEATLSFGKDTGADMDWGGGTLFQNEQGAEDSQRFGFTEPGDRPGFGAAGDELGTGFGRMGSGGPASWQMGQGAGSARTAATGEGFTGERPETDSAPDQSGDIDVADQVDLPMLAIVAPWMSKAVATVGKEHVEKLIELYDVAREVPERLKEALLLLLAFYDDDPGIEELSGDEIVTQGIPLLIELDSLLIRHRTGPLQSAILSLLQDGMTGKKKARTRKAGNG